MTTDREEDKPCPSRELRPLDVPGARPCFDIRDGETAISAPSLLMIGLPIDATGFTTLGGESVRRGDPDAFATTPQELLTDAAEAPWLQARGLECRR